MAFAKGFIVATEESKTMSVTFYYFIIGEEYHNLKRASVLSLSSHTLNSIVKHKHIHDFYFFCMN